MGSCADEVFTYAPYDAGNSMFAEGRALAMVRCKSPLAAPTAEGADERRKPARQTPPNQSRIKHACKFAAGVSLDSRFPAHHQLDNQRQQCHQWLCKEDKTEPAFELLGMKLKLRHFQSQRLTIGLALGNQCAFPCFEFLAIHESSQAPSFLAWSIVSENGSRLSTDFTPAKATPAPIKYNKVKPPAT